MRRTAVLLAVALATLLAATAPGRGAALIDFDGNGFDDLAVGAPGETVGGDPLAGAVTVFFGSASGLNPAGQTLFQANPEPGDQFGEELLADVLDDATDTVSDLAVGAPGETVRGAQFAGAVDLFFATTCSCFDFVFDVSQQCCAPISTSPY